MRCQGTTKKGLQCKLESEDGYCRHHKPKPQLQPYSPPVEKPGWIYIYTLAAAREAQVYNKRKQCYQPLEKRGFLSRLMQPFSEERVLIKVGYTTKTPLVRIKQWESQCQHSLLPVAPKTPHSAPHFDREKFGWYSPRAFAAEQLIHLALRQLYGGGQVHCSACQRNGKLGKHVEWFLVTPKQMKTVFNLVEMNI